MNVMTTEKQLETILKFLEGYKSKGVHDVVLGLSGGKDSTTVAMMAIKVWGKEHVHPVLMPNGYQADIQDAIDIATTLGLNYITINIADAFDGLCNALSEQGQPVSAKSKTNVAPRIRMTTLYAYSQTIGARVIGTGNLSESFVGWTTKFGDSACDFNPLGSSTKSEVVAMGLLLAKEFGLDEKFINKAPGDGLTGKTDEDNLGITYADLDKYIRNKMPLPGGSVYPVNGLGIAPEVINKIECMYSASEHKRHVPDIAPLI